MKQKNHGDIIYIYININKKIFVKFICLFSQMQMWKHKKMQKWNENSEKNKKILNVINGEIFKGYISPTTDLNF